MIYASPENPDDASGTNSSNPEYPIDNPKITLTITPAQNPVQNAQSKRGFNA
jgi:hypothetical protein